MFESEKVRWMLRVSEIQKTALRLSLPFHRGMNIMFRKGFIPFRIKAEPWSYEGYLDVRGRTLDDIRAALEKYVRDGNAEIVLPCNCETIRIKLSNFKAVNDTEDNVNDNGNRNGNLYGNRNRFSIFTTIAFCHISVESPTKSQTHLCNLIPAELVTELYTSLMNVAIQDFSVHKVKLYQLLPFPKITFYNKIKSTVLEQYHLSQLMDISEEEPKPENNPVIKGYFKFEANAKGYVLTDSEGRRYRISENDTIDLDMCKIHIPGLRQWHDDFIFGLNPNRKYFQKWFDVKNWFLTGRWIAQQIRQQLPKEYDLWYHAPAQDQSRFNRPAILISE